MQRMTMTSHILMDINNLGVNSNKLNKYCFYSKFQTLRSATN